MKVNKSKLITALSAVNCGLANKEVLEQSTCYVFTEDGHVVTYNDEIAVSHPIAVNFTGAVPAKEFFSFVNKVKAEEIELTTKDGELYMKGSRAKAGIRLDADIKLPILDLAQPEKEDWEKLPATFCEAVSFTLFSASKDQTKPILTCLHIFGSHVESTDNYRITRFDMGKKVNFKDRLLIPASSAKSIIGYEPTRYAKTNGWLHFKNEAGVQFSCRVFDEVFPDVSGFMSVEGEEVKFPAALIGIMDRATVFSEGDRITITLDSGKIKVSSDGDSGWFEEDARIVYDGELIEFHISPEFMKSIMKITDTAEVCDKVLKFNGENFVHIVALVKKEKKNAK